MTNTPVMLTSDSNPTPQGSLPLEELGTPTPGTVTTPVAPAAPVKPPEPPEPPKIKPPAVKATPPPVVDAVALFAKKSAAYIESYQGKLGHNPFIALRKFDDVHKSIMNKTPLTPEQIARITSDWSAPLV